MMGFAIAEAKPLFPDSETAKSEVELGVEGIQRLCPTGMWDHWIFRDIMFDRESNTVEMVVQMDSWEPKSPGQIIPENYVQEFKLSIVRDLKFAYADCIAHPGIYHDGDFMLYLSLGTLFKQMEKDDTNLRIVLLKPDYANQVFGDMPLEISSQQMKNVKNKD